MGKKMTLETAVKGEYKGNYWLIRGFHPFHEE